MVFQVERMNDGAWRAVDIRVLSLPVEYLGLSEKDYLMLNWAA